MSEKERKLKAGLFLLSGLLLLIAVLFFLGLSDIFIRKVKLTTRFNESVQGLTAGSPVKYRGVQIGNVSTITIVMPARTVWVTMDIEPRHFHGFDNASFIPALKKEIRNGLACRLEFAGITGMKFIDLDYFKNDFSTASVPESIPVDADAIFISSVPSAFQDFSTSVVNAMDRLAKIKIEEIALALEQSLVSLNTILNDPAIKSTIASINDAAGNLENSTSAINQAINEERLVNTLDEFDSNLKDFRKLINHINITSEKMKLPESSKAIREAAKSISTIQNDFSYSLDKLNATLMSVKIFFDLLQDDPGAVIRGKQQQNVLR